MFLRMIHLWVLRQQSNISTILTNHSPLLKSETLFPLSLLSTLSLLYSNDEYPPPPPPSFLLMDFFWRGLWRGNSFPLSLFPFRFRFYKSLHDSRKCLAKTTILRNNLGIFLVLRKFSSRVETNERKFLFNVQVIRMSSSFALFA